MAGAKKKTNPGKYPVPPYVKQWYQARRPKNKPQGGLPSWWPTPDLTKEVCELITAGNNLQTIFEKKHLPPQTTFFLWIAAGNKKLADPNEKGVHPDMAIFAASWSRARTARLEHSIIEMEQIERQLLAQNQRVLAPDDWIDNKGRRYTIPNPDALDPQAARIVLESRRWRLSREMPERFGDRSKVEHSGSVKVERPKDHMPEWMKEQIDQAAAHSAPVAETPDPAPAKAKQEPTVH